MIHRVYLRRTGSISGSPRFQARCHECGWEHPRLREFAWQASMDANRHLDDAKEDG